MSIEKITHFFQYCRAIKKRYCFSLPFGDKRKQGFGDRVPN